MKTVGIILREFAAEFRQIPIYGMREDIIRFLAQYDINIICVPVDFRNKNDLERVKKTIELCDGIIFPGGIGFKEIDCEIARYLNEIDKPTLGICLGMQIMGKAFNGKVLVNKASEIHDNPYDEYAHTIKIKEDSKLYEIFGESTIEVNSRHFDCVEYTDLDCVAKSRDGLIEAIEDKSKKFFIGVQWHPESMMNDKYSKKLFSYYIKTL